MQTPRLMAVLAHPDDESLGIGGTLAKYASEGADVFLLTATRGDDGRYRGRGPSRRSRGAELTGPRSDGQNRGSARPSRPGLVAPQRPPGPAGRLAEAPVAQVDRAAVS